MLQVELPNYLQSRGFNVQRGVEQEPGSAKKHLNTPPPPVKIEKATPLTHPADTPKTVNRGGFAITPDIPLEDL